MANALANRLVISYKTKHATAIWPGNCTLGHVAQRLENCVHAKTFPQMFTVALFLIALNWEQRTCPSAGEWLDRPLFQTIPWSTIQQ